MRVLSFQTVLIVSVVLAIIEIIAYWGLYKNIVGKSSKKSTGLFSLGYWLITLTIVILFFMAFADPEKARTSSHYYLSNISIVLIFLNLIPKLFLSLFSILSLIIRIWSKSFSKVFYISGLLLSLGVLLSMSYGIFYGKRNLNTERVSLRIDGLPPQANGLKVVQLSDIHLGSFLGNKAIVQEAVEKVNALQPDLILFTGDMVNNFAEETSGYVSILNKLNAKYGKFAITGNHDYGDYSKWASPEARTQNLDATRDSIRKMGFTLLLNENRKVSIADTSVYIAGVENWGHAPFPQYARLDSALSHIPEKAFTILMSHDPAHWEAQVTGQTNIPLTLSGHTHGGQFGVRIAGIEFSPIYLIQKNWGGLYKKVNQYLYVNRGLGRIGFNGRIEMRPEITLITLSNH